MTRHGEGQMSQLQEMVKKTLPSEMLFTSGGALKQLFMFTSAYAPKATEQIGKIYRSNIFAHRISNLSFSRYFEKGLRLWL